MVDVADEGAGEQPEGGEDETKDPTETRTSTPKEGFAAGPAGESPSETAARRAMTPAQRGADRARRLEAAEEAEAKGATPHHSLTSAVEALSDAGPDVELDNYGNDADSPFHTSRFGTTEAATKSFNYIHKKYRKEDLAEAYDGLEKVDKQRAINFGGAKDGSLVESAIHNMMDNFFEAQERQEVPSASATPEDEEGADRPETAREMPSEEKEAARKKRVKIEDTPASKWFEKNMPDKGADATAWDEYVSDNFGDDLSKVDEHTLNGHLQSFLKGRGKEPSTPPKPTPTAEHVKPEVQKDIVIASQDADDPKQAIEAKLAEHKRSVIDNPVLTPRQQKVMIDSANALAEVAAKTASTEDNEIKIELPDDVETSEAILEHAADIHIEAEANGESDDEKTNAADNVHDATLIHETAGGDAEAVLNNSGVEYKKLKNGQHYFQSSTATKSRGDWGKVTDLAARDAEAQAPEGEAEPSTDTPQARDERQGEFDFDAPPQAEEAEPEVKVEPEDVDDQSDAEVIAGLKRIRDARRSAPKGQKQQASLDALAQEGHIDTKEADELKTMMEQREETTAEPEAAAEEPPEVKVEPEDTPAKLSDLDALKMAHDELAQQFTQLQADLEEAKKLPNKTKKQKLDKVQKIKGIEREKQAVGKKGKRQQAKIAAHPDTPTETEEVTSTEEASEEVTTPELEPKPEEGEAAPEVAIAPPDEPGEAVAEPVVEPTAAAKPARKPRQRKPKVTPEAPAEETTPDVDDDGEGEDLPDIDKQKQFLLANKMTPDHLKSLSDEDIDKEFKSAHKKISDKAMANNLNGVPDKEELIQDMAEAHGKGSDEKYKEKLRQDHKYTSVQDLVKEHKAVEKEKAASKFAHEQNDAISGALNMDELSEDVDKLHAMDRARDIAKKMGDSNRAVQEGGKPLLDRNSMSHLKSLLDDAVDKGDLQQEDIDGIADEADRKGEDYLNDDHKASIDADNDRQRAHHEEFLDHAEGMEDHELARRGHDLDHSKAHEQHEYSINEDGTVGDRTGSSHHYRDEDGSVKHRDASGEGGVPGSEDDAVEGMEAQHPPKLLGLDKDGALEQKEHFDLMKKTAAGNLEPGDFEKYKALEAKNPNLADPKYKGQVLGAVRQQLSGEGGGDKMSAMGIDGEEAQKEAAESSCKPPAGAIHPGADKGWNPDTHRWNDKERLEELKGQAGSGGGTFFPEGSHAGTANAHLDHDENGVGQPTLVTSTGEHKVNMPQGGSKGMKTADGGAINHADVIGHHLQDHPGGKVDAKTMSAMGFDHSDLHTKEGQKGGGLGQAFRETPGMQAVGKLGQMLQRNKTSEEGQPNASGVARQRARRGKPGSPLKDTLDKIKSYTKEGLKDAAEELPGYLGGGAARDTNRYRDKQTRKAVKKVGKQQSATQKLTDSINRVAGENE